MKIPSGSQNPQPRTTPADRLRADDKRGAGAADSAEGVDSPDTETAARDFASVLDEVSNAGEGERREGSKRGERTEAEPKERAAESPFAKRREERKDGGDGDAKGGGGFEQRATLRETTGTNEQLGARAILHIADLERVVSSVRTQTLAGGVREVTIELRRSVLEGLRVKLSSDSTGRVTAEFIAASERARAQVDARASELSELMRSRGINLAEIRTGVAAGDSGADGRGGGHSAESGEGAARPAQAARASGVAQDPTDGDARAEESGTTYRG